MSTNPFGDPGSNPNPYSTPAGGGEPMKYGDPQAANKVQGPAIGLMVVGGVGAVLGVLGIVLNMLGVGLGAAGAAGDDAAIQNIASGVGGIVGGLVGIAINGLIVYGAMQMKELRNYGLAMAASILAILPCSCMCIFGIPIGIWSLVTLNDPAVKASFR